MTMVALFDCDSDENGDTEAVVPDYGYYFHYYYDDDYYYYYYDDDYYYYY